MARASGLGFEELSVDTKMRFEADLGVPRPGNPYAKKSK